MKIAEKIVYYRKRAGMSQEMLADRLGVSRQAVSKWETGETVPELSKVVQLAKVFGVTTDDLLMEEENEPEKEQAAPAASNWVESVPGVLGRLIRRYGWLLGVRIAVSGLIFTVIGAVARGISNSMMNSFNQSMIGFPAGMLGDLAGQTIYINGEMVKTSLAVSLSNPVAALGGVMIAIGVIMIIGGTALAVVLHKNSK